MRYSSQDILGKSASILGVGEREGAREEGGNQGDGNPVGADDMSAS